MRIVSRETFDCEAQQQVINYTISKIMYYSVNM
jgi:hypothetical protein